MKKEILVTGGTGYIGSHMCVALLEAGYSVVVVDNLSNSKKAVVDRINKLSNGRVNFVEADLADRKALETVFRNHDIGSVIHFAGYKSVNESKALPLKYYQNNLTASIVLCETMMAFNVFEMVFSSSCTVYGDADRVPIDESAPFKRASCPYGRTKQMVEEVLGDLVDTDPRWRFGILRYFNPVGAHESGLLGEDPREIPNNLMPYITQVAVGRLEQLSVFGNDYDTIDGTGVRDYIHVMDLVEGHLKAMQKIQSDAGAHIYNLGTGKGHSVLELVQAFESECGVNIPYQIVDRRPGDVGSSFAEATKARQELGWVAKRSLKDMVRDAWNWQQKNPDGY